MPEVRAMWVARWSITSLDAVSRVVELAKKYGYNALFVQVRGRGDAFYKSHYEPRAEDLKDQPADFDPLGLILEEAHKNGIQVHAWLNTHYVWGSSSKPVSPQHIVNRRPDWLMRTIDNEITWTVGAQTEGAYTCPSNHYVREFLHKVFLDVVKNYNVDGVHLDFVRYPSPDYCYCDGCVQRFAEFMDFTLLPEDRAVISNYPSRLAYILAYPTKWDEWRQQQITTLVAGIYKDVKKAKPSVAVSAAVFPNWEDAANNRFQDWKKWLADKQLDFICPMAYSQKTETVAQQIGEAVTAAGTIPVYAGIGSWQTTAESTAEKIDQSRKAGARGVILFSYGGVTDEGSKEDYLKEVQSRAFQNDTKP